MAKIDDPRSGNYNFANIDVLSVLFSYRVNNKANKNLISSLSVSLVRVKLDSGSGLGSIVHILPYPTLKRFIKLIRYLKINKKLPFSVGLENAQK